ncbi:MAG: bifunctional phosphoserine phosphatase/homoserine phosphotransferase ThrH [Desulfobacterales bacterium]
MLYASGIRLSKIVNNGLEKGIMHLVCSDLEGIFVPEIWIEVSKKTGIEELRLTTRDIPDYDVLMKRRIDILNQNSLRIQDITTVIDGMHPLDGADDFLNWLRTRTPIIIVSDTFDQFAGPLMSKLGHPTLFCNTLVIEPDGRISGYRLRRQDGKKETVSALKSLNFKIIAIGDSYNDITMLKAADNGFLFRPPENVIAEFPELPVTREYDQIKEFIGKILANHRTRG